MPVSLSKEAVVDTLQQWTNPEVFSELKLGALTTLFSLSDNYRPEDLKKSYKRLVLFVHPDKNRHDSNATEKFQLLDEAYQYLGAEDKSTLSNNIFYKLFETPAVSAQEGAWGSRYNNSFDRDYFIFTSAINKLAETELDSPRWSECDVKHIETLKPLIKKLFKQEKEKIYSIQPDHAYKNTYFLNIEKLLKLVIQKQDVDFFEYLLEHATLYQTTYIAIIQVIETHNKPDMLIHLLENINAIEKPVEDELKKLLQQDNYRETFTSERVKALIVKNPKLLKIIDLFPLQDNEKNTIIYEAVLSEPSHYQYLEKKYAANPFVLTLALCSPKYNKPAYYQGHYILDNIPENMSTKHISAFAYLWPEVDKASFHRSDSRVEHPYREIQNSLLHHLSMPSDELSTMVGVYLFYLVLICCSLTSFTAFSIMNAIILPVLLIAACMLAYQYTWEPESMTHIYIQLIILPPMALSLFLWTPAPVLGTLALLLTVIAVGRIAQRCYLNSEISEIKEHVSAAETYSQRFFSSAEVVQNSGQTDGQEYSAGLNYKGLALSVPPA